MSDIEFVNGLIVKAPNENAPSFVKARLSIKREELIAWLQSRTGDWINVDVKESAGGKWYASVDNWKPNQEVGEPAAPPRKVQPQKAQDDFDDNLPDF